MVEIYWTYRVVKTTDHQYKLDNYTIKEFYFNDDDTILGWTESDETPYGETVDELKQILAWMLDACDKPIIDNEELLKILEEAEEEPNAEI